VPSNRGVAVGGCLEVVLGVCGGAVTLFMKMSREGKQGSIAKRWSRRTRRNVEGRIEFRGVG